MNKQTRLERLEKVALPVEIHVYLAGKDGYVRRYDASGKLLEQLTREQFDALPDEKISITPREAGREQTREN